ncbi:HPF/RaiA family ribosome-associated protein [Niabella aquatica]
MTIQINADNHLTVSPEYREKIEGMVLGEIDHFVEHLTRIEVYLSDQNSHKDTGIDKRCNIEARLKGKPPVAVSDDAETYDQAISGAAAKLKTTLHTMISKSRGH